MHNQRVLHQRIPRTSVHRNLGGAILVAVFRTRLQKPNRGRARVLPDAPLVRTGEIPHAEVFTIKKRVSDLTGDLQND